MEDSGNKVIFSCCLLHVFCAFSSCLTAACLLLYDCGLGLLEKERTESESLDLLGIRAKKLQLSGDLSTTIVRELSVSYDIPKYLRFNIPDSQTLKSIWNLGRVKYLLKNLVMHIAVSLCI
ncbi:hypothetical protein M9H77_30970 [Catharanthus roseus]|uniref:Uncharacterized protein n=1 Tax=Catharanthus roseus TaxID=4058 RepID=A0ACC0A313_CATRO|nr:hypothetical protein M9H77_30970 [Catharanthus roseus]